MSQDRVIEAIYTDPTVEVLFEQTDIWNVVGIHVTTPEGLKFTRDTYFHWLDIWLRVQAYAKNEGYEYIMSSCPYDMVEPRMLKLWGMFDMRIYDGEDGYLYCSKRLEDD